MAGSSLLKVLLVKYHDTNIRPIPDKAERSLQVLPSLGVLYIAAVLRESGFEVELLDANAEALSLEAFVERVKASKAKIVGFTSMTAGWPSTVEGARLAREALPEAVIVVGGPQLSVYPELCLTFPQFDVGVIGGGEESMLEIAQAVAGGTSFEAIPGTVVRIDGQVRVNPERTWWRFIDGYPRPSVDLLNRDLYGALTVEPNFFTMITSRGCPFKCRFCGQMYGGTGQTVRFRSPESVVEEIDFYYKHYGAKEIVFFDETFSLKKSRVMKICRLLKENKINVSFDLRTRVDSVDEEMLEALREVGGRRIHLGVESGTTEIIERMGKGITLEQVHQAVGWAKKYGFETRGYFMIGYLGETMETYRATVDLACNLELDYASFSITTPLPNTELFDESVQLGYISEDYWKKYTLLQCERLEFPVIETPLWDEKRLHAMLKKAFNAFYLRPKFVAKKLSRVRSLNDVRSLISGASILKSLS